MILLFMKSSNLLPLTKYFVNEQYAKYSPSTKILPSVVSYYF